ncbi:hypothetical protein [Roseateles puraquae]|uniref:hypothetical protein n=1 Tax=Roseateles puraquae TaxID=431059 RepID=UPI0013038298|nr:hypothetical protein [Roseateles puraquae]MDG0852177.1 hypothetical protein [Roseateles puraquae]
MLVFTDSPKAEKPQSLIPPAARARVAMVDRLGESLPPSIATAAVAADSRPTRAKAPAIERWPDSLARQVLSSAIGDPFRASLPSTMPIAAVPASPVTQPTPTVAPVVVPVMSYRYLGQLTDPDGKRLVLISKGDKDVTVSRGSLLDDGFSVVDIQKTHITIVHIATSTPFEIRIPDADASLP